MMMPAYRNAGAADEVFRLIEPVDHAPRCRLDAGANAKLRRQPCNDRKVSRHSVGLGIVSGNQQIFPTECGADFEGRLDRLRFGDG